MRAGCYYALPLDYAMLPRWAKSYHAATRHDAAMLLLRCLLISRCHFLFTRYAFAVLR